MTNDPTMNWRNEAVRATIAHGSMAGARGGTTVTRFVAALTFASTFAAAALREHTLGLAAGIAEKSPVALRLIKEAVRASVRGSLDEGLRQETALFGLAFSSEDKAEGVKAFLEKR